MIFYMEKQSEALFAALGETMVNMGSCRPSSGRVQNLRLGRSGSGVIIPHPDLIIPFIEGQSEAHIIPAPWTTPHPFFYTSGEQVVFWKLRVSYL
jgi:hypothetical protein